MSVCMFFCCVFVWGFFWGGLFFLTVKHLGLNFYKRRHSGQSLLTVTMEIRNETAP